MKKFIRGREIIRFHLIALASASLALTACQSTDFSSSSEDIVYEAVSNDTVYEAVENACKAAVAEQANVAPHETEVLSNLPTGAGSLSMVSVQGSATKWECRAGIDSVVTSVESV